jgi:hypothetical protein
MNTSKEMFQNLLIPMFSRIVRKYPNFHRIVYRFEKLAKYGVRNSVFVSKVLSKYQNRALELTTVSLAFPFGVSEWGNKDPKAEEKKILEEADHLFDESKLDQLFELLKSQPSWYDNCEVLWRVARCEFQFSKRDPKDPKNATILEDAFRHVLKALELNEECGPAHKVFNLMYKT